MKYKKHLHILLTPEQHKALKSASKEQKKSIGEIVRDLIEKFAGGGKK